MSVAAPPIQTRIAPITGEKSALAPAVEAAGLVKWFGEGDAKTTAVRDVSFAAHFGEMLYVVGPSGSGKTTMLSIISGILRPNAGTVKIEGTDIWNLSNNDLPPSAFRRSGSSFRTTISFRA